MRSGEAVRRTTSTALVWRGLRAHGASTGDPGPISRGRGFALGTSVETTAENRLDVPPVVGDSTQ